MQIFKLYFKNVVYKIDRLTKEKGQKTLKW
jgi:hypothetical protein